MLPAVCVLLGLVSVMQEMDVWSVKQAALHRQEELLVPCAPLVLQRRLRARSVYSALLVNSLGQAVAIAANVLLGHIRQHRAAIAQLACLAQQPLPAARFAQFAPWGCFHLLGMRRAHRVPVAVLHPRWRAAIVMFVLLALSRHLGVHRARLAALVGLQQVGAASAQFVSLELRLEPAAQAAQFVLQAQLP